MLGQRIDHLALDFLLSPYVTKLSTFWLIFYDTVYMVPALIVGFQANGIAFWTLVEDNSSLHVVMWEGIHKFKFERPASFTFNHQVRMVSLVPTVEL